MQFIAVLSVFMLFYVFKRLSLFTALFDKLILNKIPIPVSSRTTDIESTLFLCSTWTPHTHSHTYVPYLLIYSLLLFLLLFTPVSLTSWATTFFFFVHSHHCPLPAFFSSPIHTLTHSPVFLPSRATAFFFIIIIYAPYQLTHACVPYQLSCSIFLLTLPLTNYCSLPAELQLSSLLHWELELHTLSLTHLCPLPA